MKTLVILSGGMDSSILMHKLRADGDEVRALGFDYGQRHRKELQYARLQAASAGVPFEVADLSSLRGLLAGSSQTDDSIEVPEGHYEDESMKLTVVPNRNMIMLAVAAGHAMSTGCEQLAYAAHAGDHAIYPDCRPEFADALAHAIALADWRRVRLIRPFITMTKTEIGALGRDLGLRLENTWSCYKGGELHCGKCGTCTERREAMLGFDPTEYQA